MKQRLLQYLACPTCGGDFDLDVRTWDGAEVVEATLLCSGCGASFPVTRGIPRFAGERQEIEDRTARAFAYEWNRYDELAQRYRQQFLDWIQPAGVEAFRDQVVLEGGCGKGRHTALAAEFGARDVVALDLGDAVEAAYRNTRRFENAHVIQADINRPPLKPVFDYAFSVGVLHHLPAPERGFRALVSRVRVGGSVSAWVYGREGNGWIVHFVSPFRERVTSRLPFRLLDAISGALTVPLYAATRYLYGPTGGRLLGVRLPYGPYLTYIADFPFREQRSIVFDHLVAPVAHYLRRDDFAGWFERLRLSEVRIEHHNGNSWRGFARVSAPLASAG